ncbi:hypothetical protein CHS0354_011499 [Potamilus streckersoni]|uniref:Uncharacterized protein n=1 Tax=Potamilus streckersoni TaxID=2493646 RepID=A0AAE0VXN0_9BIVA|nr:hypothetical protein CHS0354_011499 [Potamilus streckersoni]
METRTQSFSKRIKSHRGITVRPKETSNLSKDKYPDAKSDASESSHLHPKRFENTYQLGPDDDKRFKPKKVETVMHDMLRETLAEVDYERELCSRLSRLLSDTIKAKVKELNFQRYKLMVQVIIVQNSDQGLQIASRFIWDEHNDAFSTAVYENKSLYAVSICWGVYYD